MILSNEIACKGDVLGYDFHYNIAAIKIKTDVSITTARLRHVNDSISIDPNLLFKKPSEFQSDKFNLVPGDTVVALGRYHVKRNGLMVVAGEFRYDMIKQLCRLMYEFDTLIVLTIDLSFLLVSLIVSMRLDWIAKSF